MFRNEKRRHKFYESTSRAIIIPNVLIIGTRALSRPNSKRIKQFGNYENVIFLITGCFF